MKSLIELMEKIITNIPSSEEIVKRKPKCEQSRERLNIVKAVKYANKNCKQTIIGYD